jgi:hypothetical protein
MVACTSCARARVLYMFSSDFVKCAEYTRKGVSCDGNFSEVDFDKLSKERARLEAARTQTITEVASLDKRIEALQKA